MKISWGKVASLALVWGRVASAQEASPEDGLHPESTPKVAPAETATTAPPTVSAPEAEPAQGAAEPENPYLSRDPSASGTATHAELTAWADAQSPKCRVRAVAETKAGYLLACGPAGLWRVRRGTGEGSFVLDAVERRGGPVVGFVHTGEELLLLVDVRTVQPLDGSHEIHVSAAPLASSGTRARGDMPPEWPRGEVVEKNGLRLTVDVGDGPALGVGYRVVFRFGEERVIGRVARVWGTQAIVVINMHEPSPPLGTPLEPTPERGPSIFAPADGNYHVTADVGVRLGLSADGVFGADAGVQARIRHFTFGGEVRPFAFSTLGIVAAQAFVSVGLTTTWFGMSFGGGTTTVNRHEGNPPGTGILMTPAFRVGTIDGLHMSARVSTAFHRQEVTFTGLFLEGQIPVSRSVAVILEGGGGGIGIAEGEAGVRTLLQGNGGKRSWFLRTSGGVTVLSEEQSFSTAVAPHLHLSVETRL
jgi:hypothetical protein